MWWLLFNVLTILLAMTWYDFAQAGSLALRSRDYSALTTPMLVILLAMWSCAYLGAGWVTVLISRHPQHIWIMATPWFLYLATMHLYVEWSSFPPWYNLGVVMFVYPLTWLGGRLVTTMSSLLSEARVH